MEKCRICGKEFKNLNAISKHIYHSHIDISVKYYYDNFLKKDKNEGFCSVCQKSTKYLSITLGYSKHCSSKCARNDLLVIRKLKISNLEKYGSDYYWQSKKCQNRIFSKYGVDNVWKLKEFQNKCEHTKLKKYGDKNYNNIDKRQETNLNKYGVKNTFSTEENKYKILKLRRNKIVKELLNKLGNKDIIFLNFLENNFYRFYCKKCNKSFKIHRQNIYRRYLRKENVCIYCNPFNKNNSFMENDIVNFLKQYVDKIEINNRSILNGLELDIYLPDLKLAFEFNGLYWHSELYKDKNYHLNKTLECEKYGIHLVHIYEDDWEFKQDIVKSRILNLLEKSNKLYARDCEVREVSYNESKEFLENNHLQGSCIDKVRLGLYYENELVSLMTFGKLRKNLGQKDKEGSFELLRFCNKLNMIVVGGANKLFKYFINTFRSYEIISYADRSWTCNNNRNMYNILGFVLNKETNPNYFYINKRMRQNIFNIRKDILVRESYNINKSEHEIMLDKGIYRIYDSGQLKYIWG